jgi:RNA polymerase sigma-70 factor (ECF subfamily)
MLGFNIILERAKQGNQQSLMRLYDLCCDAVFNASYRIVLNAQDAEEITQDAVLKAFANLNSFKGSERDFTALVKTIAINRSIDLFRRHSKEPFYEEIDNTADRIEDNDDFEDYPIEKIKEALNNLPDGYRLTITMRLIEGMEFSEISEKMGIKESTVRSQYARGLEKLRSTVISTGT